MSVTRNTEMDPIIMISKIRNAVEVPFVLLLLLLLLLLRSLLWRYSRRMRELITGFAVLIFLPIIVGLFFQIKSKWIQTFILEHFICLFKLQMNMNNNTSFQRSQINSRYDQWYWYHSQSYNGNWMNILILGKHNLYRDK